VCYGLAHRTVSGAPGPYRVQPATLGKIQARSAIIHRTVRCATGLSGESAGNGYPARNGRLCKSVQCSYSATQKSEQEVRGAPDCPVWHRTVRCHKKTRLQRSTELRTLTVGCRGGAPDCPVRPSPAASQCLLWWWLRAINTP
jgi:hypothetical protein